VVFCTDGKRLLEDRMAGKRNAKVKTCRNSMTEKAGAKPTQITAQTQESMQSGTGDRQERTAVGAQQPLQVVQMGACPTVILHDPNQEADYCWRAVEEMDKVLDRLEG
jgi:hypothetical protein